MYLNFQFHFHLLPPIWQNPEEDYPRPLCSVEERMGLGSGKMPQLIGFILALQTSPNYHSVAGFNSLKVDSLELCW